MTLTPSSQNFEANDNQNNNINLDCLTPQELNILTLLTKEPYLFNKDLAELLFVSEKTIKKHRENIYEKLGVSGRTDVKKMLWKLTLDSLI